MKDTCVVRVDADLVARFYDGGSNTAAVESWPDVLSRKFRGAGVYSIRRVKSSTPRAVRVVIEGTGDEAELFCVPALFITSNMYGLCARFLRELGVSPPPEGKRKTLHLVVTKRRAKT